MYINNVCVCVWYPHKQYLTVPKRKKMPQVTNCVKGFEKFFDRNVVKYVFLSSIPVFK